jgi:hypothetical protein
MKRIFSMLAVSLAVSVAWSVAGAQAAGAPGAAKEGLVGPFASVFCVGVDPADGDISQTGPGFVIFNQDITAGTVSANVVLKGAMPNMAYVVRLIQSDGNDCFTVDATLVTNRQGNGTAHVREPIRAGSTAVNVIIDTSSMFVSPTWRAAEKYTLQ